MFKETTLAYIAGLIDGEGSIGIRRYYSASRPSRYLHYRPMIEVGNTSKEMIEFIVNVFGNSTYVEKPRHMTKLMYVWRVTGTNCIPVLEATLPYMVVKRKQAFLCLKLCKRLGKRGTKWSESFKIKETAIRHKLYLKIRFLNSGYTGD